jgi:hypothetical protein
MAKIKPARGGPKGPARPQAPGAISCLILIVMGLLIFGTLTYITFSRSS